MSFSRREILSRYLAQNVLNTAKQVGAAGTGLEAQRGRWREGQAFAASHKFNDPLRIDAGRLVKLNVDALDRPVDGRHAAGPPHNSNPRILQYGTNRQWQRAESVLEFA